MYGLIGKKLSHSYSAILFEKRFGSTPPFKLIEIDNIIDLNRYIDNNPEINGFTVTIPYKKEIIPYLNSIDDVAEKCGAVNTVKIERKNGKTLLHGFNTDVYGFSDAYSHLFPLENKNVIIIGTGGAAGAVGYVLKNNGFKITYISRIHKSHEILSFTEITENLINENKLIVNTTPLGMFPKIEAYPEICFSAIGKHHIIIDIIYNPELTTFMQKCIAQGAAAYNGMEMLRKQAEKAWKIWGLV